MEQDYFLPFYPTNNPENQNLKNEKQSLEILSFYSCVPYGAQLTKFFLILGHFLPFYPTNNPKHQILKKWKK